MRSGRGIALSRHRPTKPTTFKEKNMTKFLIYVAIVTGLGASTIGVITSSVKPQASAEARFAADGAFRDGLYLGKLAAENGQSQSLAVGRWSTEQDRAMFTAGYRRGYSQIQEPLRQN
jgi:hypothetical protein